MDFLQLVQARQSDRSYDKERPVEPEKLERILEAARLAPSACNAQPWKFVVITDKELAQKAGKAAAGLGMNKFAKDAPVHILVVEESANITSLLGGKLKGKHFPLIDTFIVGYCHWLSGKGKTQKDEEAERKGDFIQPLLIEK